MFSFYSSPLRKARALYACKAEHDSELSFTAGTVFDNGESLTWREGTGQRREREREEVGSFFSLIFRLRFLACRESGIGRAAPGAVGAVLAPHPALGFPRAEPGAGFAAEQGQSVAGGWGMYRGCNTPSN